MALIANILTTDNFSDYFKGILDLSIDWDSSTTVESDKMTELSNCVTEYQEIIFKELFGEALYNYLYDHSSDAVYTTLLAGKTIIENGYKYEWKGLRSMLAPFIYFYFKRDKEGYDTSVGEKKSNTQNSSSNIQQLNNKLKRAWNKGVDLYKDAISYIDYKNNQSADYYPEFLPSYQNYYQYLYEL